MATPFNQLAPTVPVVLNTSNCFVFGNTASGNALSVQQLGAGNVATFRTTTGATALFVNAAGNVGVGTTSPGYQLSVATGLGATGTPTVQIADTVGPKSLSVITNASSGVYNAMVATGDTLLVAGAGTTVNTGVLTLAPWSAGSVGARIGGSSNIFGIYSNATTFYSNAVSPATVMTLVNGNVGIGNTTPPIKLWVPATSTTTGIGVYNSDVALIIGNAAGGTNAGSIQVKSSGSSSTIGATNYTLALNPDGGFVGVGTTNPADLFEVKGSITIANVATTQTFINMRQGLSSSYNCSISTYDHNGDTYYDGLSLNAYDGVSICTGANTNTFFITFNCCLNYLI